jgi:hypothetical protein
VKKLVVYRDCVLSETEFASRLDAFLGRINETLQAFDGQMTCNWNERRDRLTVRSRFFTAEIMHLVRKGVVVMVNLSVIAYPFRRQIEERIGHAMTAVFESKGAN